jgi:hypothetical protein
MKWKRWQASKNKPFTADLLSATSSSLCEHIQIDLLENLPCMDGCNMSMVRIDIPEDRIVVYQGYERSFFQ